jgi:hypothetical protein
MAVEVAAIQPIVLFEDLDLTRRRSLQPLPLARRQFFK